MVGREGAVVAPLRIVLALLAAVTALCLVTAQAQAAPGAYRVLIAEVEGVGAKRLQAQVAAFPDVVKVDLFATREPTPSDAELAAYDVVVSLGDIAYDQQAWGDALADYVDGGGVVVQGAYDTWEGGTPTGRWETGGYAPLIPGDNVNKATTLGVFDASSPLMQNVAPGSLTTGAYNTENAPAAGAAVVAYWADGRPAVAGKGRVVAITAALGDTYDAPGEPAWTGNYGQIVVNAARAFVPAPTPVPQPLTVVNSNPSGGTVTSTAGGISCGSTCSANFNYGAQVGLTAVANKGFAFAGFTGACTGTACALTMDGPKTVAANFTAFGFGKGIKRNKKKGTAKVPITVGASGTLLLSGKKIKNRVRGVSPGTTKLTVVAKGKARKKLLRTGKVKVKLTLTFTPAGGTPAQVTKSIQLKRKIN